MTRGYNPRCRNNARHGAWGQSLPGHHKRFMKFCDCVLTPQSWLASLTLSGENVHD
jgi:hypothetical protein